MRLTSCLVLVALLALPPQASAQVPPADALRAAALRRDAESLTGPAACAASVALADASSAPEQRRDEALYNAAVCHEQEHNPEDAIALFERLVRDHPASALAPRALQRLAQRHLAVARYDEAARALTDLARRFPHERAAPDALTLAIAGAWPTRCLNELAVLEPVGDLSLAEIYRAAPYEPTR